MKYKILFLVTVIAAQFVLAAYVGTETRRPDIASQLMAFCIKADAALVVFYWLGTLCQLVK